ncbi:MAG: tetratricopeptide repeat protein [Rhodospirillaceae bacterium]
MRSFIICVSAALVFLLTGPGPAHTQMFSVGNSLVNEAAHALDRGRWDKGVSLARQALKSGELTVVNVPAALNNLCIGLTGQGHYDEALDTCNQAIDKRPREWSFYNNRANVWFHQAQYNQALIDYYKALTFSPGDDVLITNISLTLRKRKELSEAIGSQRGVERES